MSERYSKLFSVEEDLYAPGAPVLVAAGALLKDNQTGKVLAQLKLQNIGKKTIKAVRICLTAFDTVGAVLGEPVDHQYLDLDAARGQAFGAKIPVFLPDASTRAFAVIVKEVIFADRSAWTAANELWEPLPDADTLASVLQDAELVKQYQIEYGADCSYYPAVQKDLWYCACGRLNSEKEAKCHHCGKALKTLQAVDLEALKAKRDARIAEERKEDAAAAERRKKIVIAVVAVIAVIVAVGAVRKMTAKDPAYREAKAMLREGRYDEAIFMFETLGDYRDSAEQAQKAAEAIEAAEEQERAAAEAAEEQKRAEAEAAEEQKKQELYDEALRLKDAGDIRAAFKILSELGDYKDAKNIIDTVSVYVPVQQITDREGYVVVRDLCYDEYGLLVKEEYPNGQTVYEYNGDGKVIKEVSTSFEDDGTVSSETVTTYNADRSRSESSSGYVEEYTYDEYGNVIRKVSYRDGEKIATIDHVYEHDENGKILSERFTFDSIYGSSVTEVGYTYDEEGNPIATDEETTGLTGGKRHVEYIYGYITCIAP